MNSLTFAAETVFTVCLRSEEIEETRLLGNRFVASRLLGPKRNFCGQPRIVNQFCVVIAEVSDSREVQYGRQQEERVNVDIHRIGCVLKLETMHQAIEPLFYICVTWLIPFVASERAVQLDAQHTMLQEAGLEAELQPSVWRSSFSLRLLLCAFSCFVRCIELEAALVFGGLLTTTGMRLQHRPRLSLKGTETQLAVSPFVPYPEKEVKR